MKRIRTSYWRRCLAVLLLLAMSVTQCVTPTVVEAAVKKNSGCKEYTIE